MEALFATGRIADVIVLVLLAEFVFLTVRFRRIRRGPAPPDLVAYLAAGLCLVLAMRSVMTHAWWGWTAAWLAAGGVAHVADLSRRLRHD